MDSGIEKGPGRRHGRCGFKARSPKLRGLLRQSHRFLEAIHIEFDTTHSFKAGYQILYLLGDLLYLIVSDFSNVPVGVDTRKRHVEVPGVPGKPILNISALIGIKNQYIRPGDCGNIIGFGEGGLFLEKRSDIAGQV